MASRSDSWPIPHANLTSRECNQDFLTASLTNGRVRFWVERYRAMSHFNTVTDVWWGLSRIGTALQSGARASLLQIINRREDGAGDLVSAAEEPFGEGQPLASGIAAQSCEHHGDADEEKCCVAGDGEGGRIPPGEVEGERQCDAEREAQRAGVVERRRVAANPPPVSGQHESGEANEAECPGGGSKARTRSARAA